MTFKSILTHAEPVPAAAPRLATAASLARKWDAVLVGVGAESFDWAGVSDPYGVTAGQWLAVVVEQIQADLVAAEKAFLKHASQVKHEWVSVQESPAHSMARISRSVDLILAGGAPLDDAGVYRTASPADLVMLSGRPVLIAPPTGGDLKAEHIVVAWKDSREARRAVADAMPLLIAAETVVILEVCTEDNLSYAQQHTFDVARNLIRHGVDARAKTRIAPSDRAVAELNIEAEAIGADLIVSGAYGHNRLQEMVLGGVTRDLLRHPERFVLLSH